MFQVQLFAGSHMVLYIFIAACDGHYDEVLRWRVYDKVQLDERDTGHCATGTPWDPQQPKGTVDENIVSDWTNKEECHGHQHAIHTSPQHNTTTIRVFGVSLVYANNKFGLIYKHHNTFLNLMFNEFLTQLRSNSVHSSTKERSRGEQ